MAENEGSLTFKSITLSPVPETKIDEEEGVKDMFVQESVELSEISSLAKMLSDTGSPL